MTSAENLNSFSSFLAYGPIGLAGLMLVLTIIALSLRTMTESRERLLRQFMYVGAGCFFVAIAANFFGVAGKYPLHFQVYPLDLGEKRILPAPIIKANNTVIDGNRTYMVRSEVTASVDVSDAMNYAADVRTRAAQMQQALNTIASGLDPVVANLSRIPQIIDKNCSGGSNGVPAASNPAVIDVSTTAASTSSALRSLAASAAAASLPLVPDR